MFDIARELNKQANDILNELIAAKRAKKRNNGAFAAYHEGRAEELEKWLHSVEKLLEKVTEERTKRRAEKALAERSKE